MKENRGKKALYIGRFQPFHNGHADAIAQILERNDIEKIYIGIGSSENNFTLDNPLTAGERMQIIEEVLKEKNIPAEKFSIIPIRNIDHYALWPYHVQQYLPPIDIVFSGSPLVRQLWKNAYPKSQVIELQKNIEISATIVRKHIAKKQDISTLVPKASQKYIDQWDISQRLKDMQTS